MQMKCGARGAVLVILYVGQMWYDNKPLLAYGKVLSDEKSLRNAIQLVSNARRDADNYILYNNDTTEIVLYDNRNAKSVKTHRRRKKKNGTKKRKCKRGCAAEGLKVTRTPAPGEGNDFIERAALNRLAEAVHHVGKKTGNLMSGSSQIGDKKYHTVIKPTVMVNYHGAFRYGGHEGKLGKRRGADSELESGGENVIHINQEVNFGPPHGVIEVERLGMNNKTKQDIKRYFPKQNFHFAYT